MRASLPQKAEKILQRAGLSRHLTGSCAATKGEPPIRPARWSRPCANGNIQHIGHLPFNKILKDVVTRSQQKFRLQFQMRAGLPGLSRPADRMEDRGGELPRQRQAEARCPIPPALIEFRRECRAFAEHWIKVQKAEFERLGVTGDWAHPYTTMDTFAEAQIAREIMKFAANGTLYRGSKPVMWSVVEKTALAEAEVEYEDYTSDTIWVKFPVPANIRRIPLAKRLKTSN